MFHWRQVQRGFLVFKDQLYMWDGPKKFSELPAHGQEINAVALTRSAEMARDICVALNILTVGLDWTNDELKADFVRRNILTIDYLHDKNLL